MSDGPRRFVGNTTGWCGRGVGVACAVVVAVAAASGTAAAQSARRAGGPARFAAGLAFGASAFPTDADERPSSADVFVSGQASVGPEYSARLQVAASPVSRITIGLARHIQSLPDPQSYVSVEVGVAFLHDRGWERGAYTGAGVQFTLKGPVALTVEGRAYLAQLRSGFSLSVGTKLHF